MKARSAPSRPRRVLLWVLAFLLLGGLTTYSIAIIAARQQVDLLGSRPTRYGESIVDGRGNALPSPVNGTEPPESMYFEFGVYEGRGVTFGMSRLRAFQNYTPAAPPNIQPAPQSVALRWERAALLPWIHNGRPWPEPAKGDSIWVKAAGWPLRATVARIWNTPIPTGHTWHADGGLIVDNPDKPGWADWPPLFPSIIPLRPLWPEFLADSMFFGIWWVIPIATLMLIRHRRRHRRGHCVQCGYNLSGLPVGNACPECGNAAQKAPV